MKHNFVSVGCFTIGALAALSFASTASAGSFIYVDDASTIFRYAVDGTTPPPSPTFASGAVGQDEGLAVGLNSTVFAATETGIYSYSVVGKSTLFAAVDATGIAISAAGNLYAGVTSAGGEIDLDEFTPQSSGPPTETLIKANTAVDSLAFDSNGNLYEADDSGILYKYTNGVGSPTALTSSLPGFNFFGVAVDNSGDVFVTYQSGSGGGIEEYSSTGTLSGPVTFTGTSTPTDVLPMGLAYDGASGELYMSYLNGGNGSAGVDVFSSTGVAQSPLTTSLTSPTGIVFVTPEPGTLMLLFGGLLIVPFLRRRSLVK